jgi:hypothetical protein
MLSAVIRIAALFVATAERPLEMTPLILMVRLRSTQKTEFRASPLQSRCQ